MPLLLTVIGLAALTSITIFLVMQNFIMRRDRQDSHVQLPEVVPLVDSSLSGTSDLPEGVESAELVAQFRSAADGGKTISLMEVDGRHFLRADGKISDKERQQMMRYLKAEGFIP